jgi:hypothetical protein
MRTQYNRPVNLSRKKLTNTDIVPYNYYAKNYKNTDLIPKTKILNYILRNFAEFQKHSEIASAMDTYALNLDDCFLISEQDMPPGVRKNDINISFPMNPKTPLDKLIAYCFYILQPGTFKNREVDAIKTIKNQIGKDVPRDDRILNGKPIDMTPYRELGTLAKKADFFYQTIINHFNAAKMPINIDIINKICLLSCQNVFSLISDLMTIKLNSILSPETNTVFRSEKVVNMIINRNEISIELKFSSLLIISRDEEPMDPEYPCGKFEFVLYIDLLHNKYEMKKFGLSYDIDKCGPEKKPTPNVPRIENDNANAGNVNANANANANANSDLKYLVPAGVVTAGLVATPFLLSLLGGKQKYTTYTKRKKQTKIKKNKNKNRKTRKN